MDFYHVFGYLTGLLLIRPDMDSTSLFRTAGFVHFLDAILCRLLAGYSGRGKNFWTFAGLLLGIWALGTLFLLPVKARENNQEMPPAL